MTRILITGFGPFPGAPSNPTAAIVHHLLQSRKMRFKDINLVSRVLPTEWAVLDGFAKTIREIQPDAILMFGLSGRRAIVTPEIRAINRATRLRHDADGQKPHAAALAAKGPAFRRSSINPVRMSVAIRQAGVPSRTSQNAGDYLCNGLLWTALETDVPSIFVHVPLPRRAKRPRDKRWKKRLPAAALAKAGEVVLLAVLAGLHNRC